MAAVAVSGVAPPVVRPPEGRRTRMGRQRVGPLARPIKLIRFLTLGLHHWALPDNVLQHSMGRSDDCWRQSATG